MESIGTCNSAPVKNLFTQKVTLWSIGYGGHAGSFLGHSSLEFQGHLKVRFFLP